MLGEQLMAAMQQDGVHIDTRVIPEFVEKIDDAVLANNKPRFATQSVEDASKFGRDIAAASNQDAAWLLLQPEKPVGRDTQLRAWNVRYDWLPAGRDDNPVCVIVLTCNRDGIRVDETRSTNNSGNAALIEVVLVNTVKSMDIAIPA